MAGSVWAGPATRCVLSRVGRLIKRWQVLDVAGGDEERVDGANAPVVTAVFEILRYYFVKAVALGVRPQMRVKP